MYTTCAHLSGGISSPSCWNLLLLHLCKLYLQEVKADRSFYTKHISTFAEWNTKFLNPSQPHQFQLTMYFITMQCYCKACDILRQLSVCPSVTPMYCIRIANTTKPFSQCSGPIILDFSYQITQQIKTFVTIFNVRKTKDISRKVHTQDNAYLWARTTIGCFSRIKNLSKWYEVSQNFTLTTEILCENRTRQIAYKDMTGDSQSRHSNIGSIVNRS